MTEQEQYQKDKDSHDAFIRGYKAAIRDAERFAENYVGFGVVTSVIKRLNSECSMRDSCDAPNPPGYYRANND
jgi:hypothetical protein